MRVKIFEFILKEKANKLSFVGKQNSLNLCKILHHSLEMDTFRYGFFGHFIFQLSLSEAFSWSKIDR